MLKRIIIACLSVSMLMASVSYAAEEENNAVTTSEVQEELDINAPALVTTPEPEIQDEAVIPEETPEPMPEPTIDSNVITDESQLKQPPSAESHSDSPDGSQASGAGVPLEMPSGGTAPDMITEEAPKDAMRIGEIPFEDVSKDAWYYDVINRAYNMRLISGISNAEFAPESNVTGAQLLMMLYRAAGNIAYTEPGGTWYDCAVNWAKENKVLKDDMGWQFNPEANLEREQMMVVLYNYMMYKNMNESSKADLSSYTDNANISSWAYDAIAWLVGKGYIQGSNNALRPKDYLTRAESCVILVGAVNDANSAPQPTVTPEPTPEPLEAPEMIAVPGMSVSPEETAEPEATPEFETTPEPTATPAPEA